MAAQPLTPDTAPAKIRIHLLGGFRAERDGVTVPDKRWERRGARSLVKLLALSPVRQMHRERITDLLWPELDGTAAESALRKALHFARHALEPDLPPRGQSTCLQSTGGMIVLSPDILIDTETFHARLQAANDR